MELTSTETKEYHSRSTPLQASETRNHVSCIITSSTKFIVKYLGSHESLQCKMITISTLAKINLSNQQTSQNGVNLNYHMFDCNLFYQPWMWSPERVEYSTKHSHTMTHSFHPWPHWWSTPGVFGNRTGKGVWGVGGDKQAGYLPWKQNRKIKQMKWGVATGNRCVVLCGLIQ